MKPLDAGFQHISATELRLAWCMHPGPKSVPLGWDAVGHSAQDRALVYDMFLSRRDLCSKQIPGWSQMMPKNLHQSNLHHDKSNHIFYVEYSRYIPGIYCHFPRFFWALPPEKTLEKFCMVFGFAHESRCQESAPTSQPTSAQSQLQAQRILGSREKSKGNSCGWWRGRSFLVGFHGHGMTKHEI